MNCNEAVEILLRPEHKDRQAALSYMRNHPECLARVDQLARTVVSSAGDELPCAEARSHFADYYTRQQAHGDAAQRFSLLHIHLDRCPYCQAEYGALTESMALYANDALQTVTAPKPWNLDFLQELPPTWTIDGLIRRLTHRIVITVTNTAASFDALSLQLVSDVYATAMRGDDDIRYAVLSVPDETAAIRFHFDIKPTPNGMANVTLRVTQTETEQPLPNLRIALQSADGTLLARSLTDHLGEVEFPQMNADEYIIQARSDEDLWKIPMTIVAE